MKIVNGKMGRFRQVVIKPSGQVAPVLLAKWTGQTHQQYTVQRAEVGDYIVRAEWECSSAPSAVWRVWQVSAEIGLAGGAGAYCFVLDTLMHPDIQEWLSTYPDHTLTNQLPPGFGWNGRDTLYSKRKETLLRETLKGLPFSTITRLVDRAVQSPADGLPGWDAAMPMPEKLHNHTQIYDGTLFRINTAQIWYGWDRDGFGALIPVPATAGSQRTGNLVLEYSSPPTDRPAWAQKLMCVTLGAYLRNSQSFGIKWRVYAG